MRRFLSSLLGCVVEADVEPFTTIAKTLGGELVPHCLAEPPCWVSL